MTPSPSHMKEVGPPLCICPGNIPVGMLYTYVKECEFLPHPNYQCTLTRCEILPYSAILELLLFLSTMSSASSLVDLNAIAGTKATLLMLLSHHI